MLIGHIKGEIGEANPIRGPFIVPGTEGKRLVSNSSRNSFTFCPRSFELANVVGLRKNLPPLPLSVGSMIHDAIKSYYLGQPLSDLLKFVDQWEGETIDGLRAQTEPDFSEEKVEAIATIARYVIPAYVEKYGATDLLDWEVLAVEAPFVVPLVQTLKDGSVRVDPIYAYTGKFDLVVRNRESGLVFVVDHKTTVMTNLDAFQRDAERMGAGQRIGYVYAARYFWGKKEVAGLVYNVLRKKAPAKPGTVTCKTCSGQGSVEGETCAPGASFAVYAGGKNKGQPKATCNGTGIGGLSKTLPDSTALNYRQDIDALLALNPGIDTTQVEEHFQVLRQRGDRFLYRFSTPVSDEEVRVWYEDVYEVAHGMGRAMTAGRWWRNLSACDVNGRRCGFAYVCPTSSWDGNDNFKIIDSDPFAPYEAKEDEGEED